MDQLIPVINRLQDVTRTIGKSLVELPQIVVVGNQSSGKSSLIENIVGKEFLPRGTGIVTRRPLILQLIHLSHSDDSNRKIEDGTINLEEWCKFDHVGDKIFTDFSEVCQEIEKETERLSGSNKGICNIPITLKVFSVNVITLTLIDLPGMTKIPVGDQPSDIEQQIRNLILKYISNKKAIILAVTAANTDITTSEALKLAREVDKNGDRTLAVLTKLDIMDAGSDATQILQGKVVPVKKGIIGIVNRSQKDIMEKKSIQKSLEYEAAFLQEYYPHLAKRNGTPYLRKVLNNLLMYHIKDWLPELKAEVSAKITQYQSMLSHYGENVDDKQKTLLTIINEFDRQFRDFLEGSPDRIEITELIGGARVSFIFKETFGKTLESIDAFSGFSNRDILTAIKNAKGLSSCDGKTAAFELLVKRQIQKLEEPSLRCVELVHDELERIIQRCNRAIPEIIRFPNLKEKICEVVSNLLKHRLEPTKEMIKNLINIELDYIDTNHPDLTEFSFEMNMTNVCHTTSKLPSRMADMTSNPEIASLIAGDSPVINSISPKSKDFISSEYEQRHVTEAEKQTLFFIKEAIKRYFVVVRKKLQDSVPKTIMHFLVKYVKNQLNTELVSKLYVTQQMEKLFEESVNVIEKRKEASDNLKALLRINEIINELRDGQFA